MNSPKEKWAFKAILKLLHDPENEISTDPDYPEHSWGFVQNVTNVLYVQGVPLATGHPEFHVKYWHSYINFLAEAKNVNDDAFRCQQL